jgi:hypothetical protein
MRRPLPLDAPLVRCYERWIGAHRGPATDHRDPLADGDACRAYGFVHLVECPAPVVARDRVDRRIPVSHLSRSSAISPRSGSTAE